MKKLLIALGAVTVVAAVVVAVRPAHAAPVAPTDIYGGYLQDGDLISAHAAAGDPDIFIVKLRPFTGYAYPGTDYGEYNGFKRLFLNPSIFNMYGHLGGYHRVRQVSVAVRDSFVTSGLFRNCETGDQRVWAVEVTGEDAGILHHVQVDGGQAAAEDPNFFHKVFCINSREDAFYPKSVTPYYRIADIPRYFRRACQVRPACLDAYPRCMIPEPAEGWCPNPTATPTCLTPPACAYQDPPCAWMPPPPWPPVCPTPTPPPGCYYQQVQCVRYPCDPVLVCPSPTPTPGPCYVGGCSGQLCTDQPDAVSTCEYRQEYACYRYASCERQASGQCGWTPTSTFNQCWSAGGTGY